HPLKQYWWRPSI
nr:Chain A, HIS-PRO-LEU-LYS-GLN-TYR-TRP-TRP-ARG-PRO-SER-ILE [synthetic construct]2JQ2_A Chain A, pw2 [synthetic construct]